jgi:hypothetical protein
MDLARPIDRAKLRRARAPWAIELGTGTLALAAIAVVAVTSLLYLTQASRVAATGYDISSALERQARLEREQQRLLVEVVRLESLARIESDAVGKLAMVPAPVPDYVAVGEPALDVDAALERAVDDAQHKPSGWREWIAAALRLGTQS